MARRIYVNEEFFFALARFTAMVCPEEFPRFSFAVQRCWGDGALKKVPLAHFRIDEINADIYELVKRAPGGGGGDYQLRLYVDNHPARPSDLMSLLRADQKNLVSTIPFYGEIAIAGRPNDSWDADEELERRQQADERSQWLHTHPRGTTSRLEDSEGYPLPTPENLRAALAIAQDDAARATADVQRYQEQLAKFQENLRAQIRRTTADLNAIIAELHSGGAVRVADELKRFMAMQVGFLQKTLTTIERLRG